MNISYLKISGWDGAIRAFYMSLSNYTPELESKIRIAQTIADQNDLIDEINTLNITDSPLYGATKVSNEYTEWWNEQKSKLIKFGDKHITLVKYLDITMTVVGLHRGAQDDFDAHAARFDSRIVRMSTRTKNNEQIIELSDYYKGKILPFHELAILCDLPVYIETDAGKFIRTSLGYVKEDCRDDKDVRRGLLPLAISSTFTVKVQAMEYCHVCRERNKDGNAHPELKDMIEMSFPMIEKAEPLLTRDFFINCCMQ